MAETSFPNPYYSALIYTLVLTISSGWMQQVAIIPDRAPKQYGFTGAMRLKNGVRIICVCYTGCSGVYGY